jgi:hypothetical protein
MRETCRTHGEISMHTEFQSKILERRRHLGVVGISGRVKLKLISEKQRGIVYWIRLVHNRDQWQSLENTVMKKFQFQ